jgi:hypothetical protein
MQAIGCILFAIYGVAQIVASFVGFDYYVGAFLAAVFVGACIWFRFTLPLTIAAFLGAKNVWEWHWFLALIFAAPGLLLAIPSILGSIVDRAWHTIRQ